MANREKAFLFRKTAKANKKIVNLLLQTHNDLCTQNLKFLQKIYRIIFKQVEKSNMIRAHNFSYRVFIGDNRRHETRGNTTFWIRGPTAFRTIQRLKPAFQRAELR